MMTTNEADKRYLEMIELVRKELKERKINFSFEEVSNGRMAFKFEKVTKDSTRNVTLYVTNEKLFKLFPFNDTFFESYLKTPLNQLVKEQVERCLNRQPHRMKTTTA